MADIITMNAKDAVSGSLGECYVTLDGRRYNLMTAIKFEASFRLLSELYSLLLW